VIRIRGMQVFVRKDLILCLLNVLFEDAQRPKAVLKIKTEKKESKIYSVPSEHLAVR
jgi:hypothetical protein